MKGTSIKGRSADRKGLPVHGGVVNDTRSSQDNAKDAKRASPQAFGRRGTMKSSTRHH